MDSLVNTYFHAVHLPILSSSLHLVFILYKFATLEEKTSGFSPPPPTRTHPHEEDSDWYVQAVCNRLPRRQLKRALRKPFLQGPLFCLTCKMEILPERAEVHILDNRAQLSLSAQQRADRGMPALPALCPGWTRARSPAETPSHCWPRARAAVPVLSRTS